MSELHREKDPPNYHSGIAITPFNNRDPRMFDKSGDWDMPIGFWRERAYVWRVWCLSTLVACVVFLIFIFLSLTHPVSSILAVEITHDGFVTHSGIITEDYDIPPRIQKAFLQQYLTAWYSHSEDAKKNQINCDFINHFTSSQGRELFQRYVQLVTTQNTLYNVSIVDMRAAEQTKKSSTWVVKWQQIGINALNGRPMSRSTYQGTFELTRQTPQILEQLQQNPLGFYVKSVHIAMSTTE